LEAALDLLDDAIEGRLESVRHVADLEEEVHRLGTDRSTLAQMLDEAEARSARLDDVSRYGKPNCIGSKAFSSSRRQRSRPVKQKFTYSRLSPSLVASRPNPLNSALPPASLNGGNPKVGASQPITYWRRSTIGLPRGLTRLT
jgi:hypothetical protein